MDTTSPTREIQKRLLLTLHQDGLLDILAGSIVANFGLVPILDETGMNPGIRQVIILSIYAAAVVAVLILKRTVTQPRSGYVRLARRTTARISVILLIVNIIIFLVFALAYFLDLAVWEQLGNYQLSVPLGLIFLTMCTFAGALLKAPRFHLYGLMVMASFVGGEHLYSRSLLAHHGLPHAAFVSGGIMVVAGSIMFIKFIRGYSAE